LYIFIYTYIYTVLNEEPRSVEGLDDENEWDFEMRQEDEGDHNEDIQIISEEEDMEQGKEGDDYISSDNNSELHVCVCIYINICIYICIYTYKAS
jgi:hypothetical protein